MLSRKTLLLAGICALVTLAGVALGSQAPPAQALGPGPVGVAGNWTFSIDTEFIDDSCTTTIVQNKTSLTFSNVTCPIVGSGSLSGTLDLITGAFTASGTVGTYSIDIPDPNATVPSAAFAKGGTSASGNMLINGALPGTFTATKTSTGNEFSISAGFGACDTNPATAAGPSCTFDQGEGFEVQVSLDSNPTPFRAYASRLNSTALPYQDRPGAGELPLGCIHFPPFSFWLEETTSPTSYATGCGTTTGPGITHTGPIVEVDYTCSSPGTISLVHGASDTYLIDANSNLVVADSSGASENLTINCVTPPPAVAEFSISAGDEACDTNPSTGAGTKCSFATGSQFSVQVRLDSFSLPDTNSNNMTGYTFWQGRLGNYPLLPYKNQTGTSEVISCSGTPEEEKLGSQSYIARCVPTTEATDTGVLMEVDYTCNGSGQIFLAHGNASATHLWDDSGAYVVDSDLDEFLTINCVDPKAGFQMAFISDREGGNHDIYKMNGDGSGQTRLTTHAAYDSEPSWSPDGTKIAFYSDRAGGGDVFVMNPDGSGQTDLTNAGGSDGHPTWSPDGMKIAFQSTRDGNYEIYVMDADGSPQTRLTSNSAVDANPSWSPDGTKIAFASNRTGNGEIFVMNADGSGIPTNVTNNSAEDYYPQWSPDGTKIAFNSNRTGNLEIFTMNANGTSQTNVSNAPAYADYWPRWKAGGELIAFHSNRGPDNEVFVMNTDGSDDGSDQTNVTNNPASDGNPDWSRVSGIGADFDQDGCTDAKEAGTNQVAGGRRNPQNFWDFFDTPDSSNVRDKAVAGTDFFRILARFGAHDTGPGAFYRFSDPLSMPNAVVAGADRANYHPALDRGASSGPNGWNLTAADGAIAGPDFFAILAQFGHTCA